MDGWEEYSRLVLTELQRLREDNQDAKQHHEKTNALLNEYNTQLQIHVAGVQTLDRKTDLLKEEIELFKNTTNTRLEVAELPIKWFGVTAKIIGVTAAAASIAAAAYKIFGN